MTNKIIKEGYLTKEGGSFKNWKKRWFVLSENNTLAYFKKEGDTEPLGVISLTSAGIITTCDRKKKANSIELPTPSRTFYLCAENEGDKQAWLDALNNAKDSATKKKGSKDQQTVGVADFELLNLVGKGSFGKVIQVKKKDTGEIFAMKVLSKKHIVEHNEVEHTRAEKNILMKLQHPFLVGLNYSFQTEDKLYFILDYVNGGELFYHLQREKRFSEERVRYYGAEIVLALEYLHNAGVIYRDLKPENLLLTNEGHICMTDFGLCKEGMHDATARTETFCGTPEYLAPEVLVGQGYGRAVDWWSFGSLIFEMLTGLPPFYSSDVQEMYRRIMTEKLEFPDHITPDAKNLLEQLLERDPEKRLIEPNLIKRHAFFKTMNWEDLFSKRIPPPYLPKVQGKQDISQIDPVFTEETPTLSMTGDSSINQQQQQEFEGFTFVASS